MKRKYADADINALSGAVDALNQSTSLRMLRANLEFLVDYYLVHPSDAVRRLFEKRARRSDVGKG